MRDMIRIVLLLAVLAAPLAAQGVPERPADRTRLAADATLFGTAMRDALALGEPGDVTILVEALSGTANSTDPEGDWNCRTIKMGRLVPLVVYGNFRCRITRDAPGLYRLEKLSGSQRIAGTIHAREGRSPFRGVAYVDGGPAADYAALPPDDQTPVEPGQTVAVVGTFEQMSATRARLLLPDPILESEYDILYLTR